MPLHKTCTSATHSKAESCCFQSGLIKAESKCQLKIKGKKKKKSTFVSRHKAFDAKKTHKNYRGGENNLNISVLPKTFLTGGNFCWIVATASSWSCKLSRRAAGFSFSRLADQRLWQSSSLFSKAQLKAAAPVLAGPTLVHLQHLYHPVTEILAKTEIKTILERRFGMWQH